MSDYRVALDVYHGPLDLLLFLIRRDEIEIHDVRIARITEQYIEYVSLLEKLDPEAVSEFLVLAATLIEIKSRALLPHPPAEEEDDTFVDPRSELVRQLLEYKKFKDAAHSLHASAEEQKRRHAREPSEREAETDEHELDNLEIWDLFDAFRGLLEQITAKPPVHEVGVDDTPLALHAVDISDSLERAGGTQRFDEVFAGRTRAEMIGLFLALLELIRQRRVRASQDSPFGPILLHLIDATPLGDFQDDYEGAEADDGSFAPPRATAESAADDDVIEESDAVIDDADELGNSDSVEDGDAHLLDDREPVAGDNDSVASTSEPVARRADDVAYQGDGVEREEGKPLPVEEDDHVSE